jgi:hypothetical protein
VSAIALVAILRSPHAVQSRANAATLIPNATNTVPPVGPIGTFTSVRAGSANNVGWSLESAPGAAGTRCWRLTITPSLLSPRPICEARVETSRHVVDPADQVRFLAQVNGPAHTYNALAVAIPDGVIQVTLGFAGGKLEPLPVTTPLVWIGSTKQIPAYLGITLANGTTVRCFPGTLLYPPDIRTATRADVAWPWSCI